MKRLENPPEGIKYVYGMHRRGAEVGKCEVRLKQQSDTGQLASSEIRVYSIRPKRSERMNDKSFSTQNMLFQLCYLKSG